MAKRFIFAFLFLSLLSSVKAQELWVMGKKTEPGAHLQFWRQDLERGRITFLLKAPSARKADISFDRGHSWEGMQKKEEGFIYKYHPRLKESLRPVFLVNEQDRIYTFNPRVEVDYSRQTPKQAVISLIDKMKAYYEAERKTRFLNLFSRSFPDLIKFEEAIQNDFYNYHNIRLDYTVYRQTFSPDYRSGIWSVEWKKKYTDLAGSQQSEKAVISMWFQREGGKWLISGMRNNTIFGSSLLAVDISISSSDIVKTANYTVTATVRNRGEFAAKNVQVKFYEDSSGSYQLHCTKTISSVPAGGTSAVNCDFSALGPGPVNIKVVIDEPDSIAESNETNNTAVKNITLG